MYWDKSLMLSHNKLINMVLSNRGGGKTYGCTDWAIADFKKRKKQCVWVRRYATEVEEMLKGGKFFKAIQDRYPDDELKVENNIGYINGEEFIYFVALSTSRQLKSNNFPDVNKIIYDEFIIDKSNVSYLRNEVEILLDLIETVDRMRDEVRAVLLANAVTVVNPYFMYFKIKPDLSKRFTVSGEICVELFTDAEYIAAKKKTRFGRLVDGTRYGDYAIDNKWLLDTETFIEEKTPRAECLCALKYNGEVFGFWADYSVGLIFVNRQYDPYRTIYALTKDDHEPNLLLIKSLNDSRHVKRIVYAFRNSLLRFSDAVVKGQFYEFIGYFVR